MTPFTALAETIAFSAATALIRSLVAGAMIPLAGATVTTSSPGIPELTPYWAMPGPIRSPVVAVTIVSRVVVAMTRSPSPAALPEISRSLRAVKATTLSTRAQAACPASCGLVAVTEPIQFRAVSAPTASTVVVGTTAFRAVRAPGWISLTVATEMTPSLAATAPVPWWGASAPTRSTAAPRTMLSTLAMATIRSLAAQVLTASAAGQAMTASAVALVPTRSTPVLATTSSWRALAAAAYLVARALTH